MIVPSSPVFPGGVKLIKHRGTEEAVLAIRLQNGCTTNEVPNTNNKSHAPKSESIEDQNFRGKFSPKKTMSG